MVQNTFFLAKSARASPFNISASAVPSNKDTFKTKTERETESCNITVETAFFVIINELLRGHRDLEFRIVQLLERAPQT